jgi:BlaI family transcriptional regulator, penicillinase repressor
MGQPALSDAEWKVMNAVWGHGGEVSARDVHAALERDTAWAYTTVKTLMDRLVQKEALVASVHGNVSWYKSRLPRRRAVSDAARDLIHRAFGGSALPLVHHLIKSHRLTPDDKAELRRLLDDDAKEKSSRS